MTESRPQRPLVILPTYNERENIEGMVRSIRAALPTATVWVVDDNSPDGTGALAAGLAAADPMVEVIHRPAKEGLGVAYIDAYTRGLTHDFDCFVQMDADYSHDPSYLPTLLDALDGADMVIGSRYVSGGGTRNWSAFRQFVSRAGNVVARLGLGVRVRDATGGYRAMRRSTVEQLHFDDLRLRGYSFQIEVVFQIERRGLRIVEVPIIFVERLNGRSKMTVDIALETFGHILRRRLALIRRVPEPEPDAGRRVEEPVART